MLIKSITKTTLLDYPGKVASIIFLVGCNMNCVYCHNKDLVYPNNADYISEEELFEYLKSKIGKIDGICITGGEPTIQKDIIEFIKKIKEFGFLVKLDTNGTNPDVIKELINNNLIDYIAMDIKHDFDKYQLITNKGIDLDNIKSSIELIKNSSIDHEFRTTVINKHDKESIVNISKIISPSKYFLQEFRYSDNIIDSSVEGLEYVCLEDICSLCNRYTETKIRKK